MKIIIYIVLIFSCIPTFAQQGKKINCQALNTDMGLSQNSVLSIEQDSYGFIWLGTRDGLNLYDGNKILVYKNVPGDENSISGNLINDITEAEDGGLWIAHNNGVSLLDRNTGIFKNFKINAGNKEIRSISIIDGKVWACGWDGLFVLDDDMSFSPYTTGKNNAKLLLSTSKIFKSTSKEGYWVATTNNGLCLLDTVSGKIKKIFTGKEHDIRIEDILFHPNGNMYVGTYGKGLLECDTEGNIIRRWTKENTGGNFKVDNIRSLTVDKSGVIWIGGFQGLTTLDPYHQTIHHLTPIHSTWEINDISIRSLYVDKNGSLWLGAYHNGVLLYDEYFSRFVTMPLKSDNSAPIRGIVSAFAVSSSGKAYVATENGYLFEFLNYNIPATNRIVHQPQPNSNLVFKSLYYQEKLNQLWVGTLRDGLFLKTDGKLTKISLFPSSHSTPQDTIDYGVINNIIPLDSRHIWLLTDKRGALHLLDMNSKKLVEFPAAQKLQDILDRSSAKYITKFDVNSYLLGTKGAGLLYFNNTLDSEVSRILPEVDDINHIAVKGDHIYVSTQGSGLFVLDRAFKVIRQYTTGDNLRNNIVLGSFPDDNNNLWVYTFNGVNLMKSNGDIATYDTKNGFQLAEVNTWKPTVDQDGKAKLLAGGKDVWIAFSPDNISDNPYIPTVFLTAVKLGNKTISDIAVLNGTNAGKDKYELLLNSDETLLTIEFAGTNYLMPENSRFRYMMEGYDQDWVYTDHQGSARYNKLPTGKYIFKVQACNNDGIWSDNIAELAIRKSPPWWLSWKAFVLYFIAAGALFYYLRKNEIKKIKLRQQIRYKEVEKQRIAEAHALKIRHFNDISHEIRTPLTLILHPMEELMENDTLSSKDKRKILSMQYHGKNLLLLVNQLLEINRLELKKESLDTTPTYLKELVSIIYNSFQPIAEDSGIHWEVDVTETIDQPLEIDRLQMEKVLLNLLTNAFKFTPGDGTVKLVVSTKLNKKDSVDLQIKIIDNGIGISEEDLPHIFERLYKGKHQNNISGSGIGLALVKAIIKDLMKGTIQVSSIPGQGTTFEIHVSHIAIVPQKAVEEYNKNLLTPDYIDEFMDENHEEYLPQTGDGRDNRRSVLLVEDNIILLNTLSENLRVHYKVFGKTNAEDSIEFLKEHEIDLIISDMMLPKMNGKDFCAEVKSNIITSHIPFVLLTAVDGDESKLASLELGADDYLTKPFIFKELILRINNILKQRERWRNYNSNRIAGAKPDTRLNKYDEDLIRNIDDHLEEELDNAAYTIEDLSKDIGLSRVHLFRKLKALTGLSPSQYIRNYKLNKALSIIEKEHIRVADLAYRVGFQDPNYFLKCFKTKFGSTPTEFARNINS
ncbi:MAG TPA: ATP-binding protein [Sphingobacterium sp.]|nr:ATP-binding protein [Sphingobacterium sp.]